MPSAAALAYMPLAPSAWVLGYGPDFSIAELLVPFLCFWLLSEVIFYIFVRRLHKQLDAHKGQLVECADAEEYFHRVFQMVMSLGEDVYPLKKFFSLWCGTERMEDIKKGNVMRFVAWVALGKKPLDCSPAEFIMLRRLLRHMEHKYGLVWADGVNPDARALTMTCDPLEALHRPLVMYLFTAVVPRVIGEVYLRTQGFSPMYFGETRYWYKPGNEGDTRLPMVFFHGVSPGQCTYAGLTTLLCEGRAAILIEIPYISMMLEAFRAMSKTEVVELVRGITRRHGIFRFCVCGHSYGSICAGFVIRGMREEVKQAVLLDPVALLLCLPNTQYAFLYRRPLGPRPNDMYSVTPRKLRPGWEWLKLAAFDYGLHYVVSNELTVSNAMRRQFYWREKILHSEHLHCPTIVALSSDDMLLCAKAIQTHVKRFAPKHVDVLWWEDFVHGEFLLSLSKQADLDRRIRAQEDRFYGRVKTAVKKDVIPQKARGYSSDGTESLSLSSRSSSSSSLSSLSS